MSNPKPSKSQKLPFISFLFVCLFIGCAVVAVAPFIFGVAVNSIIMFQSNQELANIRHSIEKIPGVTITKFDPAIEFSVQSVDVTVHIQDKGDLGFYIYWPDFMHNSRSVFVSQVGEYTFEPDIDIGPEGKFHSRLPVDIQNVSDAIRNFDQIHQAVVTWPEAKK